MANKSNVAALSGILGGLLVALVMFSNVVDGSVNDRSSPSFGGPMSSALVTESDLLLESPCARDFMVARIKHGMSATQSDLFYSNMRCNMAQGSR